MPRNQPALESDGWAPPDIDLQQFSATEIIAASELDKNGKRHGARSGSFEYFASIERVKDVALTVQEFRNGSTALDVFPSKLASMGTAASALVFHPLYKDDFVMECEGLGVCHDKPAWQVHFAQRPDKANNFRSYYSNGVRYPARIKGRAGIAADSYQVVRLESELAEPIKDLVQRELRIIEYTPVAFPKRDLELWLPQTAELYIEYRKHRFHNRQTFSDFQLFWVDTAQVDKLPKPQAE